MLSLRTVSIQDLRSNVFPLHILLSSSFYSRFEFYPYSHKAQRCSVCLKDIKLFKEALKTLRQKAKACSTFVQPYRRGERPDTITILYRR